jgi:CheY-like chemotaxis protein
MARILFVDDDVLTLELMGRLVDLLGHEAVLCSIGAMAPEMACQKKPNLILVDLNLSDKDGLDVIVDLQQLPATAQIPIFVLSAGISPKISEAASRAGAWGCLEKPLSLDVLNQVIKTHAVNQVVKNAL